MSITKEYCSKNTLVKNIAYSRVPVHLFFLLAELDRDHELNSALGIWHLLFGHHRHALTGIGNCVDGKKQKELGKGIFEEMWVKLTSFLKLFENFPLIHKSK